MCFPQANIINDEESSHHLYLGHPFIKLIREDSFFHRWTPGEDEKLFAYIQEHVHGSWRALPSKAG
ncbi:hypothetical protein Lser_V15G05686 [Lactuca serriola]